MAVAPVLYAGVAWLGEALETAPAGALVGERLSAGLRPAAWRLFAQALLERPLAGYGWGQTFAAQLAAGRLQLHTGAASVHVDPPSKVGTLGGSTGTPTQ